MNNRVLQPEQETQDLLLAANDNSQRHQQPNQRATISKEKVKRMMETEG